MEKRPMTSKQAVDGRGVSGAGRLDQAPRFSRIVVHFGHRGMAPVEITGNRDSVS
jgi:hypothetical protein